MPSIGMVNGDSPIMDFFLFFTEFCMTITLDAACFVLTICIFPSWEGKGKFSASFRRAIQAWRCGLLRDEMRVPFRLAANLPLDLTTLGSRTRQASPRRIRKLNMKFHIANMTCGGCAKSVGEAIASVDPGADISFDMANRVVEFESRASKHLFTLALASEGYPASRI